MFISYSMNQITMSSPSDNWSQFYYQSISSQMAPPGRTLSGTELGGDDRFTEATVVATTVTPVTAPTLLGSASSNSSGTGGHLSLEGRVSKPVRRRSRASRRTPTTLLNTDATNFRAMVQQFTGGPSAAYASGNATNFSLGLGLRQTNINPSNNPHVMVPATAYHLQHQPHQAQQQQQQYQHQNQPRPSSYMFSLENNNNNNNNSYGHAGRDFFFQRLGDPTPATTSMENISSDGFFTGPPPSAPPSRPPFFLR